MRRRKKKRRSEERECGINRPSGDGDAMNGMSGKEERRGERM